MAPGVLIVLPPPASAVGSDIPVIVVPDPTQGEDGLNPGARPGAGSSGLTPALPISVAPSGMVPIPRVDPAVVPETNGFCVPDTVLLNGTELHGPEMPVFPPPSKVEVDPTIPEPLIPGVALPVIPGVALPVTEIPFVPQRAAPVVPPSGAGLRPPGLSSVEPKGMPTWPTDPVPPSGDVMPIPGAVPMGATCARTGAAPSNSIAVAIESRHLIAFSIRRPSGTVGSRPPRDATNGVRKPPELCTCSEGTNRPACYPDRQHGAATSTLAADPQIAKRPAGPASLPT
jgi:hypothetical protein